MVAMTNVQAFPSLAFSDPNCHLEDTGTGIFCLQCPDWLYEDQIGSSYQENSPSAGKNNGVDLVPQ